MAPVDVDAVNHIEFGLPLLTQGDHLDLVASLGKGLGVAHDPVAALLEGLGEHGLGVPLQGGISTALRNLAKSLGRAFQYWPS